MSSPNSRCMCVFAKLTWPTPHNQGVRCGSVVRAFAHGAMGRRIDPSWGGPIELFLVAASAGVTKAVVCAILSVGWCI